MHPKSHPAAPPLTLQLPTGGRDLGHAEVGGADDIVVCQTVPATQPVMPSHRGPGGGLPGGFARGVSRCLSHSSSSAFPPGQAQAAPPVSPLPAHQSVTRILIFSHMEGNWEKRQGEER